MPRIKFFTFIVFLLCVNIFIALNVSAEDKEIVKPAQGSTDQDKLLNDLTPEVDIIKEGKEEVRKDSIEVKTEKAKIMQEKKTLEQNLVDQRESSKKVDEDKKDVILEKLETIKKKEEFFETRESLIKERMQAYERISQLVEQKLDFLKNTEISFEETDREVRKANIEIERLNGKKKIHSIGIENLKKEIKLLDQDIWARKTILELKEQGERELSKDALKAQKERLGLINGQIEQLSKKTELVDVQLSIYEDYLAVIKGKRWEQFKNSLFAPKKYILRQEDRIVLGAVTILFFLFLFVRKKLEGLIADRFKTSIKSSIYLFRMFLISGLFFLLSYYIVSVLGYHFLAHYIIEKILLTIVLLGIFVFGYRLLSMVIAILLFKNVEGESQQDVPFFTILKGLIWLSTVFIAAFVMLSLWGVERGHYAVLLELSKKPFLSFGTVHVSIMVIVQFVFLVWIFNFLSHVLNKFLDTNIYPRTRLDESAQYSISVAIKYLLILIGAMMGLRVLGFELATLTVLAGTIGIGIGIGLQEIAKNFISGIIMLVERPIKVGDWIEIGDLPGRVQAIKARGTVIQTFDNISVVVPNSEFITKQIINWSYSDKVIRLKLPVGVIYGSDVDLVKKCLLEVASEHPKVLKHPEPYVIFNDFGDNSLGFYLYVWTDNAEYRFKLMSELHFAVNKLFKEHNLVIAFPQRDIHLKSSDVVFEVKDKKEKR